MGWISRTKAFFSRPDAGERSSDRKSAESGGGTDEGRITWDEICQREDCRDRWVALDDCHYDGSGRAVDGLLVDADDDLAELCRRLSDSRSRNCAVLFCNEQDDTSSEPPPDPFRHSAH